MFSYLCRQYQVGDYEDAALLHALRLGVEIVLAVSMQRQLVFAS